MNHPVVNKSVTHIYDMNAYLVVKVPRLDGTVYQSFHKVEGKIRQLTAYDNQPGFAWCELVDGQVVAFFKDDEIVFTLGHLE